MEQREHHPTSHIHFGEESPVQTEKPPRDESILPPVTWERMGDIVYILFLFGVFLLFLTYGNDIGKRGIEILLIPGAIAYAVYARSLHRGHEHASWYQGQEFRGVGHAWEQRWKSIPSPLHAPVLVISGSVLLGLYGLALYRIVFHVYFG